FTTQAVVNNVRDAARAAILSRLGPCTNLCGKKLTCDNLDGTYDLACVLGDQLKSFARQLDYSPSRGNFGTPGFLAGGIGSSKGLNQADCRKISGSVTVSTRKDECGNI